MVKKIILLAVILVMIFSLFACKNEDIIEEDSQNMIELHNWFFTSGVPNNAILFSHEDEKVVFECSVNSGEFISVIQPYGIKSVNARSGDTLFWRAEQGESGTEHAFIEIILKIEDNIIGYALIEILQIISSVEHTAELFKSVLFPKVGGEYQIISENQVKSIIEKLIENKVNSGKFVSEGPFIAGVYLN